MLNRAPIETEPDRPPLGEALRARRKELKLSMQQVADTAGLSVGFISQVERGLSSPSLGSLSSIASILGLPLGTLLDEPQGAAERTFGDTRQAYSIEDHGLSYERLSTKFPGSRLNALVVHERPGHRYEPISHEGEEMFFILSGAITIEIEEEVHVLGHGDSIHFESRRTHSSWNHGEETASFLWCGTMDVFGDAQPEMHPMHKDPDRD